MDARACVSSYFVLCSIWVLLAVPWVYINVRSSRQDWLPVWICISVAVGFAIWLLRFRLTFASGVLTYQTLFATRSIRLEEIEKVEIETFRTSKGSYQALLVYPKTSSELTSIKINPKVFSRDDVTRLFDILGDKLKSPRELGIYVKEKF
jgi:hypothetical protein